MMPLMKVYAADTINGYLRKSVVKDPVRRGNTGDNTPAMLYTEIVPGDQIKDHSRTERLWKREYEP